MRGRSYTVDVVEPGEEALELAPRVTYDAILLDTRLPTLTGIQVCRELRELQADARIGSCSAAHSFFQGNAECTH